MTKKKPTDNFLEEVPNTQADVQALQQMIEEKQQLPNVDPHAMEFDMDDPA
jgi:hypothetical protein